MRGLPADADVAANADRALAEEDLLASAIAAGPIADAKIPAAGCGKMIAVR
ncbi:MAG TPA: hypothetical protein VGJ34_04745 [Gaiellaceae bacterium]